MPLTNFPNGITSFGMPVLGGGAYMTTGTPRFVSSTLVGASDGNDGLSPAKAMATLDAAIGRTSANVGDVIFLMPNHSETITGAGGITADVNGVAVIGLGVGSQRPRFLMDGAPTVTYVVTAADHHISNCVFAAGHADIVRCFNITGSGFNAHGLEFIENVATENFLIPFDFTSTTDNNADDASITHCHSYGLDASATEFIAVVADIARMHVNYNVVIQSGSTDGALIKVAAGKSMQTIEVLWNFVQHAMTAGDLLIDNDQADNTGIVAHNRCRHADVTGAHSLNDIDGVGLFDNLSVSTNILSGVVLPAIDVDL